MLGEGNLYPPQLPVYVVEILLTTRGNLIPMKIEKLARPIWISVKFLNIFEFDRGTFPNKSQKI